MRAAVRTIFSLLNTSSKPLAVALLCSVVEQMDPAFKSSCRDLHRHRGGSCGTATSFTRATIDLVIRDLLEDPCLWRQASHLLRFAPLQGMGAFQPRTGAQGLEITTRKAARGTCAHFVACKSFLVALVSTHSPSTCRFSHLLPQRTYEVRQSRFF